MNSGLSGDDFLEPLIAAVRRVAESERLWRPVEHLRGSALMRQGDDAGHIFVLLRGLIKLAYATPDGGERVKSFIADRGVFGPAIDDVEERYSAVALEPSRVVALPTRWLSARFATHVELRDGAARLDGWIKARKEARERALLCDSAEQRYRDLLREQPDLAGRLQQGDIARYIGVTPIALSRIKRRIATEQQCA